MTRSSAPGKLVLSGEYAVLDGAPAVAMAVDRRAEVRVSQSPEGWHSVKAPGFTPTVGRFRVRGHRVEWLEGEAEFRLVDAVMQCVGTALPESLAIELDTVQFLDAPSGGKIGIGSSAALAVALLAALRGSKDDLLDQALEAHRRFQSGRGSGVDVATSIAGGLIEFRREGPSVQQLEWPEGLGYRLLYSGVAASTVQQLDKLGAADAKPSRDALAEAAARMAEAWHCADAVMAEYPDYIEALRRFGVDHDLGIFDAGHDALAKRAMAVGLVYKPCGAGGGDVGVLLGRSESALDDFVAGDDRLLACALDQNGIRLHAL